LPLTKFISRASLEQSRVDREHDVIRGVSLVSLGDARGHGKAADQTTLKQVIDCAKKYQGGLRVRFNPNTFNHGDASLVGFIANDSLQVKDNKVVGDLHVYHSFPNKDYLYEMAERAPDNFGLSIEFNGVDEQIDNKFFARCEEIFAATVVDLPAANPTGLFAAKDELTKDREGSEITKTNKAMTPEELKEIGTTVATAVATAVTEQLKKELQTFRMQQGTVSDEPSTPEEESAAGCTDDMTPEQKQSAVNDWRKKADTPLTKKDLMQFFRTTGGRAVKVSGNGEGAGKDENVFETTVRKYKETGMSESKAIARAARDHGKAYNEWCAKGRPALTL
jgi:hypothetical protein